MKFSSLQKALCMAAACVFILCVAQNTFAAKAGGKKSQASSEDKGKPAIQVKETVFSFGESKEGSIIEHDFVVRNTGKAVLNIDKVRVS